MCDEWWTSKPETRRYEPTWAIVDRINWAIRQARDCDTCDPGSRLRVDVSAMDDQVLELAVCLLRDGWSDPIQDVVNVAIALTRNELGPSSQPKR